ncbi:MAG TPA: PAS domain-containing protein [Microbacterium sp.]|nr:PAS domain-containing protein [Microbacterium sp.]
MISDQQRSPEDGARGTSPSERELLIGVLTTLVESLGQALPPTSELLLHDLAKLPNSIVAIHGDVTRREVGDPATDLLLAGAAHDDFQTRIGYETKLPDGRQLKSSTVIVRDSRGAAVAAVCVNSDQSVWAELGRIAGSMLARPETGAGTGQSVEATTSDVSDEIFTSDVDELAQHLIERATAISGIPVELMRKKHKIDIVRELSNGGFFMLKGAADKAASALQVSRFTIYNYLNEISEADDDVAGEEKETA